MRHEHPKFIKYLDQTKKITDEKEKNVRQQIAKILNNKFGDEAFIEKQDVNGKKTLVLSQKSINYIYTLFCNANKIWESW